MNRDGNLTLRLDAPLDGPPDELMEFRRYADDLPLFVWMQRPDGSIDWANRTWLEFAHLPQDLALSPDSWSKVVHPDDLPIVVEAFELAVANHHTYEIEHRVKPADADESAYRWVFSRSTPRFGADGQLSYWLGTAVDIHDSKTLAEQSLKSFRLIGDAVPQMMWTATADGANEWYNRRWYDFTGQTREQAHGWGWKAVHHPDDLPRVLESWARSVATGTPWDIEFRLRGADGVFRWFLTRAVLVQADDGSVKRWYGSNTDIDAEHRQRTHDAFFARVGVELARALSVKETLEAVTRLITPEFADWALVSLIDGSGTVRLAESHHRDVTKDEKAASLIGRAYVLESTDTAVGRVMRTGRSALYETFSVAYLEASFEPDLKSTIADIGVGSAIWVAMVYAGKPIGRFGALRGPDSPPFSAADVVLFEQLATRIAPAIGNAESYDRERRIAQTF